MTPVEQAAGRLLMTGLPGPNLDKAWRECIQQGYVGGVLLFERNIESPAQLRDLIATLKELAPHLLIAIDQEGGSVARLHSNNGFPPTPSAEALGQMSPSERKQAANQLAATLCKLGIQLNFSPCVDLKSDNFIGMKQRCFSEDAKQVIACARDVIEAHRDHGIHTCIKHYPGHGYAQQDSHEGFTDITETWDTEEEEPFAALIHSGHADSIMVGHLYHQILDPNYPASLSKNLITERLRESHSYTGLIVTDDLDMGAIASKYRSEQAASLAIRAGADLLVFANHEGDPERPRTLTEALTQEVDPKVLLAAGERVRAFASPTHRQSTHLQGSQQNRR